MLLHQWRQPELTARQTERYPLNIPADFQVHRISGKANNELTTWNGATMPNRDRLTAATCSYRYLRARRGELHSDDYQTHRYNSQYMTRDRQSRCWLFSLIGGTQQASLSGGSSTLYLGGDQLESRQEYHLSSLTYSVAFLRYPQRDIGTVAATRPCRFLLYHFQSTIHYDWIIWHYISIIRNTNSAKKSKSKAIPYQAVEAYRVVRC
jgi:hypothetical protein